MADDAAPVEGAGQAGNGTDGGQSTEAAPVTDAGQASASNGNGTPGKTAQDSGQHEDHFFDPKSVPKELEPAYKQMQAAFTKKMQSLSTQRQKAEFADQFYADPVGNMQKLAAQFGYKLSKAQAEAAVNAAGDGGEIPQDWQPQSWQEVLAKAEERAEKRILNQLRPLLAEVQQQKKQTIEKQLAEIDPTWQQYEDAMVSNLREHPTLSKDPAMLYRLSVPQEVIESRAVKQALAKFESKAKSAIGAGGSNTTKKPGVLEPEQRFSNVTEAAEWARRKLEEDGHAPPRR